MKLSSTPSTSYVKGVKSFSNAYAVTHEENTKLRSVFLNPLPSAMDIRLKFSSYSYKGKYARKADTPYIELSGTLKACTSPLLAPRFLAPVLAW